MLPALDTQCVINANSQFWEQMLAMSLDPKPMPADFCETAGHVLASVSLSGMWTGRIEVRLSGGLAQQAAAAMLMQPLSTVVEADTLDASKEIANMIAGVIKSSLPRPCAMTVPVSIVAEEEFSRQPPGDDELAVVFSHAAGDLMVRVLEYECMERPRSAQQTTAQFCLQELCAA
jgi:CheY-specific phosphatase CheX